MLSSKVQRIRQLLTREFSASPRNSKSGKNCVPIRTFDPKCLQPSDFLDMSNNKTKKILLELKDGQQVSGAVYYSSHNSAGAQGFPERTRGFLYSHHDPRLPSTTGEIRFRVTDSSNPRSFEDGFDLLGPDGVLPWSIPLLRLKPPLKKMAIQDGILDSDITTHTGLIGRIILTFLEKPFVIDLERSQKITILTPGKVVRTLPLLLLPDSSIRFKPNLKGKVLVSFEHASSAKPVNGTSFVMRVLNIIEPIQRLGKGPTHQPIPTPGSLITYVSRSRLQTREFDFEFLKNLPSITGLSPSFSLSCGLDHITPAKAKTAFADRTRRITTLDLRRLEPSDFTVLSGRIEISLRGSYAESPKSAIFGYDRLQQEVLPFPPDTTGFFYMHRDPRLPLISGQIRFRLTPSNDPAQFEKGTDLMDAHGEVWHLSAPRIAQIVYLAPLKELLYHDGYTEFVQALSALPQKAIKHPRALYYLEQPFVMDMSQHLCPFTVIWSDQIGHGVVDGFTADRRDVHHTIVPYTGRVLVHFERSTLPKHANGNFVVVRVLKILDPIKPIDPGYDMYMPVPSVGSLLLSKRRVVRGFDLDKKNKYSILKYLPSIPNVEPDLKLFR